MILLSPVHPIVAVNDAAREQVGWGGVPQGVVVGCGELELLRIGRDRDRRARASPSYHALNPAAYLRKQREIWRLRETGEMPAPRGRSTLPETHPRSVMPCRIL